MDIPPTTYQVSQMPDNQPVNPYVFIVGSPRSGTTLLQRIVDAHPDIAILHEMRWIVQWYKRRTGLTSDGLVTRELISYLTEYRKLRKTLEMRQEELERLLPRLVDTDEPVSYACFISGVFDLYGEAKGKRLVGDKTPEYARNIDTLHSLWPAARFVHLIRDGRDASLSILNFERPDRSAASRFATWAEDPLSTAVLWWEWHVRLGREAGESLGPDLYHEIRYESLISRPAEECAKLCEFLDVPYDDAMLRFHEGRTKREPGLEAKAAWLPITPGLRDWRSELSAGDVERVEALVGDLLSELGYPRAFPRPREEAVRYTSRIRELFEQDPRALKLLRRQH